MTPTDINPDQAIEFETPVGTMLIAKSDGALSGVWFVGQQHFPDDADQWPRQQSPLLERARAQIEAYLAGQRQHFDLPLAARGTNFQQQVWQQLATIPYAQHHTYGEIARAIDKPGAARAVGRAVGRNPWTLVIPCHRVIGQNRQLTGYAGGLERKRWLLALEAHALSRSG